MIHHTAVLTKMVTSLGQLLIMNATKASSWWGMSTESVYTLATGMEASQFANVSAVQHYETIMKNNMIVTFFS